MSLLITALHMGPLHRYEQVLTVLLAFGPFLLLGLVAVYVRRRDAREEDDSTEPTPEPGSVVERSEPGSVVEPSEPGSVVEPSEPLGEDVSKPSSTSS